MRTFFTLALIGLFTSFSAQETLTYPYNPDGDVDGAIASPDLLDILGVYGNAFTPSEIEIDGVNLLQVIQDLQNQIASIPIIDVNNVEYTLAVLQQQIDNLNQQIAENALPDGIFSGDILRWNGTAWIPVSLLGCMDDNACNYDSSASIDDSSCLYYDECGVCDGDNSTCLDECGVINGDNSTCTDNCGVVNGTNDCIACGDLISHKGYDYSTVLIGDQCWFSENCRYLPIVSDPSIDSTTEPHYSVYGYEGTDVTAAQATANYATYGVLYNWPAVMREDEDICPAGWHIPTDGEFTELTDFLDGESVAGGKMKSSSGWNGGGNGSNSSGFTGLPGGGRYSGGGFISSLGDEGYWWSASESGSDSWSRALGSYFDFVYRGGYSRDYGFSARCVRD